MNVFLVTSPFQYICANEARVAYGTENNILILVLQKTEAGKRHLAQVYDKSKWDHVYEVNRGHRTFVIPRLLKKIKKLTDSTPVEHFFFSEYTSWRTRMFQRNLPANKLVFIDDGMANLYEYFKFIRNKSSFSRKRLLQDFLIRLQGCQTIGIQPYADNFEMFSIFNIQDPVCPLTLNELNVIREKIGASACYDPSAPIAFIGEGAIGDKNQPTLKAYIERLRQTFEASDKPFLYFPHRTESEAVTKVVKSLPNLIYHQSESPIELEIANKGIKISGVTGVTSTALYTLSLLYKEVPISAHTYDSHVGNEMIEFLVQHFEKRAKQFSK
ncbi:glycosyltransferase 52 family protein [Aliivibrio sp. S2TY2]|uniref:polysialyltransferase family glycosyltransferase n=1 Tax=unclassified Aliivibrio TaxID=2645654 RepID=UPI0023785DD7|nr:MULTISPECIES: polysialyltransferase family glycosyltransferase [unclassified Aliivibrio]MDD9174924.1 glycosyltransferase 52 family protein [Aliivibrio sp. S3TY1]MDD9192129.1 glycosyltransferase 52 family protein [Aliivibrio sp. S2TY2]